jgi:Dictyostelium (slime mold) repeat
VNGGGPQFGFTAAALLLAISQLSLAAVCGNGIVESPEDCDGSSACCASDCTFINCDDGNPCTVDVCNPVSGCQHIGGSACCGDGIVEDGEECDLGAGLNGTNGACCTADCRARAVGVVCREPESPCHEPAFCTPDGQCPPNPASTEGTVCHDGDPCTELGVCRDGSCQPGIKVCDFKAMARGSRILVDCLTLSPPCRGGRQRCGVSRGVCTAVGFVASNDGEGIQVTFPREAHLQLRPRSFTRQLLKLRLTPDGRALLAKNGTLQVLVQASIDTGSFRAVLLLPVTLSRR